MIKDALCNTNKSLKKKVRRRPSFNELQTLYRMNRKRGPTNGFLGKKFDLMELIIDQNGVKKQDQGVNIHHANSKHSYSALCV